MLALALLPLLGLTLATNDGDGAKPVPATWDGTCYYPRPDPYFDLDTYLGRWYQVAGTVFPYTEGSTCVAAFYTLNDDGSVAINNTGQKADGSYNEALGVARPVAPWYGATGAFQVSFEGVPGARPNPCPGPDYIVQDYTGDWAVVQSRNFSTLFLLSREQHPGDEAIDVSSSTAALTAGVDRARGPARHRPRRGRQDGPGRLQVSLESLCIQIYFPFVCSLYQLLTSCANASSCRKRAATHAIPAANFQV
jgi:apolipoprotein D and lipocalin family protein